MAGKAGTEALETAGTERLTVGNLEVDGRDALRLALLVYFCLWLFENLDLLKRYVGGLVVSMNNRRISAL